MKCPNCQTELPENAKFCMSCGKTLQVEIIYSYCDHTNPSIAEFRDMKMQPLLERVLRHEEILKT